MDKKPKKEVFIPPNALLVFTDGSYRPEGNAAYAFLIYSQKAKAVVTMQTYACRNMTINQMELAAIGKALEFCNSEYVIIYSDSAYSISCLTLWRHNWAKNNWITPLGVPVKNREIIEDIGKKIDAKKFVRFVKVDAHTGDPFNSVVDYLCAALTHKMREDPSLKDGRYM